MVKYILRLALAGFVTIASMSGALPQVADMPEDSGLWGRPAELKPNEVGSGGDFSYSVAFDLPKFRGLEPSLGLGYNSSNTARGGVDNFVAFGWQLTGLSRIDRVSVGGGAATFDDGQDIYRLDGAELMACNDSAATNKFLQTSAQHYPLRYLTDQSSASCLAGGNLTTRVESFQKIYYDGVANTFTISQPNGRRYVYRSVGSFFGDTSTAGDQFKLAHRSRWLLAEITDAQKNGSTYTNVVTFDYAVGDQVNGVNSGGTIVDGFPERISKISYANYLIQFNYASSAIPSGFPTGTAYVGQQRYKLQSVLICDNGSCVTQSNRIRGYNLVYSASALTQARLLQKVQTFGKSAVLNATTSVLTGSYTLPETTFEYSVDQYSLTSKTFQEEFHSKSVILDTDRDGAEEFLEFSGVVRSVSVNGSGNTYTWTTTHTYPNKSFKFNPDLTVTEISPTNYTGCPRAYPVLDGNGTTTAPSSLRAPHDPVDVLPGRRSADEIYCFGRTVHSWESGSDNYHNAFKPKNAQLWPAPTETTPLPNIAVPESEQASGYRLLNLDLDPEAELLTAGNIYDIASDGSIANNPIELTSQLGSGVWFDVTGDGVTDIVSGSTVYRIAYEDGFVGSTLKHKGNFLYARSNQSVPQTLTNYWWNTSTHRFFFGFGDINGDGANDALELEDAGDATTNVLKVYYSTGSVLAQGPTYDIPKIWTATASWSAGGASPEGLRPQLIDINADGLADIVFHMGFPTSTPTPSPGGPTVGGDPFESGVTYLLLNNGNGFQRVTVSGSNSFPGLVGIGDMDGNGLLDFVQEGTSGKVLFSTGDTPSRLTAVNEMYGGRIEVAYTSSRAFGVSEMAGVRKVVDTITRRDGRGGASAVRYTYSGMAYDFENRQPLGYEQISQQHLPAGGGAAYGPIITTTYRNTSLAERGNVESQVVADGGATQSRLLYSWQVVSSGNGPYSALKTSERSAVRFGADMIETRRNFTYSPFGAVTGIAELGLSNFANGNDLNTADNTLSINTYPAPSVTDSPYIVSQPSSKIVYKGASVTSDRSQWLSAEYYFYDGQATTGGDAPAVILEPTEGNLTRISRWTGDVAASTAPVLKVWSSWNGANEVGGYDPWGNLVGERNAKLHATAYTYDSSRHLFRVTTTNALSEVQSTAWDYACQTPASTTDINALVTTLSYDAFCRETGRDVPGPQNISTSYVSIGTAGSQYVQTSQVSPDSSAKRLAREYFDGFHRTYKTAASGSKLDSSVSDPDEKWLIATLKSFDEFGRVAWETRPGPLDSVGSVGKTTYTYDSLGRLITRTFPDDSYETLSYGSRSTTTFGVSVKLPLVTTRDALCFDGDGGTLCGRNATVYDPWGRRFRDIAYDSVSMAASGNAPPATESEPNTERVTSFTYDLLGQLEQVDAPGSATWTYHYDQYGNRTSSSDPGLGDWTMAYDSTNNLTTQTDAKGQTIAFTYDDLDRVLTKIVTDPSVSPPSQVKTVFVYSERAGSFPNKGKLTTQKISKPSTTGSFPSGSYYDIISTDYDNSGQVATQSRQIDDVTLTFSYTYAADGATLTSASLPIKPGDTVEPRSTGSIGTIDSDVAGRVTHYQKGSTTFVTSVTYNVWGLPDVTSYGSGAHEDQDTDLSRGWITQIRSFAAGQTTAFVKNSYARAANGRIASVTLEDFYLGGAGPNPASMSYDYDYAGRLVSAISTTPRTDLSLTQCFEYDIAGRITKNGVLNTSNACVTTGAVGAYSYSSADYEGPGYLSNVNSKPKHAPAKVAGAYLSYDKNGNTLTGLDGKVMTYDAENRPLSVTFGGSRTCYVYGADGARLKKIVVPSATACPVETAATIANRSITLYVGIEEIRNWRGGATYPEQIFVNPLPNIRLAFTTPGSATVYDWTAIHHDAQGSVRGVTNSSGAKIERTIYRPYGNWDTSLTWQGSTAPAESHSWIGERFDAEAGLQYLNARYYDPKLAMFTQPDWWEVTEPGVGTTRYAYSGNDPVNGVDPGGHDFLDLFKSDSSIEKDANEKLKETARNIQTAIKLYDEGKLEEWRLEAQLTDLFLPSIANEEARLSRIGHPERQAFETAVTALSYGLLRVGGISRVSSVAADASTAQILQYAAKVAASKVGNGSGAVYGTRVHTAFEAEVKALASPQLATEVSFLNGRVVPRGTPGSVRLDVVEGQISIPSAIFDLKTGSAQLTQMRILQIQSHLPGGRSIPITVIRP